MRAKEILAGLAFKEFLKHKYTFLDWKDINVLRVKDMSYMADGVAKVEDAWGTDKLYVHVWFTFYVTVNMRIGIMPGGTCEIVEE